MKRGRVTVKRSNLNQNGTPGALSAQISEACLDYVFRQAFLIEQLPILVELPACMDIPYSEEFWYSEVGPGSPRAVLVQ